MRRLSPILAASLLALSACTSSVDTDLSATVVRTVEVPLPLLEGRDLGGAPISTADYAGSVLVINAWASWCGPCEQEQPELVRLAGRYEADGVAFLGLNYADQTAQATQFVRQHAVPYPSIVDQPGRLAGALGFVGLPDTYVVDATGTIRYILNGPTTERQLGPLIDAVLAAQPASTPA